jgi:hypothetical protein
LRNLLSSGNSGHRSYSCQIYRSAEATDDPAGDRECWRWSAHIPRAGGGNPATRDCLQRGHLQRDPLLPRDSWLRILVSSCFSPSVPSSGNVSRLVPPLQASKLNKLCIFKALAAFIGAC